MMFLHRLNRLLFFVELQQTLPLDPFCITKKNMEKSHWKNANLGAFLKQCFYSLKGFF